VALGFALGCDDLGFDPGSDLGFDLASEAVPRFNLDLTF
jgi:hypothetical protein